MKKVVAADPVYSIHEHNVDAEQLHIYLTGWKDYMISTGHDDADIGETGVEHVMATQFIKNLQICMHNGGRGHKDDPYRPILIHMKTCGGDVVEGMAIYDAISLCPNPTIILNYTHSRSMSSLILQAATKRVMMPHSYFMFHEGDGNSSGTEKQVRSAHEFYKRYATFMFDIYINSMKHKGLMSKLSRKNIRSWLVGQMNLKEDVYLPAAQTVELGLADEIFDGNWKKLCEIKK